MTAKKRMQDETAKWKEEIDAEAIEFERTIFDGFSSLSSLQEIQRDLATKNN